MAKKANKQFEGMKAMTPTFRASYLTVFKPRAFEEGADEKFSVEMLFHKKQSDLTDLKAKMQACAVGAWGKDKTKWPKNFRWPFKDGDEKEDAGEAYAGHVYARCDSKKPPGIFDQSREDIINEREFVSGDYARASLFMVPYENIGGKHPEGRSGIKLYLQGIQLIKKGEPLGAAGNRNDFEVVENDEGGESGEGETETDDGFGF